MGGVTVVAWIVGKEVVVELGEAGTVGYGTAEFISICPHHLFVHGEIKKNSELHEKIQYCRFIFYYLRGNHIPVPSIPVKRQPVDMHII